MLYEVIMMCWGTLLCAALGREYVRYRMHEGDKDDWVYWLVLWALLVVGALTISGLMAVAS